MYVYRRKSKNVTEPELLCSVLSTSSGFFLTRVCLLYVAKGPHERAMATYLVDRVYVHYQLYR